MNSSETFLFFMLIFLCLRPSLSHGQVYLQLERVNKVEVKKYGVGSIIDFRLKSFEDAWIKYEILDILPKDDALVFYDQIVHLDEITHFKYRRGWANASGTALMTFGGSWLIFGGAIEGLRSIGAIETQYEFGTDTAIIGLSTLATGYLTKKLWGIAIKKMNKNNRLRIVDVTF